MNGQEALARMVPPSKHRPGKMGNYGGVIQIWMTRSCDKSCFGCTQGSNLRYTAESKYPKFLPLELLEGALRSLEGYFGVVGIFGGNPATHPQFEKACELVRKYVPYERRGLWSNNPLGNGKVMRETFNPAVCNLNVHLDAKAYDEFKRDWPESMPFGLDKDSRHSPPFVSMRDVGLSPEQRWELISSCDINQHWSAMIGMFRGELRAWFCEIAGAQSMLHQDDPNYPDTGLHPDYRYARGVTLGVPFTLGYAENAPEDAVEWWQLPMSSFIRQAEKHCHDCGVPLRGYGELAQSKEPTAHEQVSAAHASIFSPKNKGRALEFVTNLEQLGLGRLARMTDYMGNAKR